MDDITVAQIRQLIAEVRALAEADPELNTPETLARAAIIANENCHNDFDILLPDLQEFWILLARMALREIETGELTPEK